MVEAFCPRQKVFPYGFVRLTLAHFFECKVCLSQEIVEEKNVLRKSSSSGAEVFEITSTTSHFKVHKLKILPTLPLNLILSLFR
jgi:hypothetical protein